MADVIKNCFIVNAPAGSGKTTYIKTLVTAHIAEKPNDNILCITYTNRAADELSKDIQSSKVVVSTIHSFLADFLQQYFKIPAALNCYYSLFESRIRERIDNVAEKEAFTESNKKYIEKYGAINFETVCSNIKEISYNESPYSALYYGRLSHDDLILFASKLFQTFPQLSKRLSSKFQYIFVDEYQDTSADVLRIFFNGVQGTSSSLYLFGDKMQQIYKNYDGSFEQQFTQFDDSNILKINYRSTSNIIKILNKIYNDTKYQQIPSDQNPIEGESYPPRIIIASDVQLALKNAQSEAKDTLILFLLNKERFSAIGAVDLYEAYSNIKYYGFTSRYTAVDILTNVTEENPDPLMKLIYLFLEMQQDFALKKYGSVIQKAKHNTGIFEQSTWRITSHKDKIALREKLETVINTIDNNATIGAVLNALTNSSLVSSAYIDNILEDDEYQQACAIPVGEVIALFNYMNAPNVSTQHGVKGESHDSVIFLAEDYKNAPIVNMYLFFDIWGHIDISLDTFQQFYYKYISLLREKESSIGYKFTQIDAPILKAKKDSLCDAARDICTCFKKNKYFLELYQNKYQDFLAKQTVKNMRAAFNEKRIYGVLSAYKLFYVGCSRARRNLTILLDRSKMQGDIELQLLKFKALGFDVICN